MSQESDAALLKAFAVPPENRSDVTMKIRRGLIDRGISFRDVTWIETEAIVESAIAPFRQEIARLRKLVTGEEPNV